MPAFIFCNIKCKNIIDNNFWILRNSCNANIQKYTITILIHRLLQWNCLVNLATLKNDASYIFSVPWVLCTTPSLLNLLHEPWFVFPRQSRHACLHNDPPTIEYRLPFSRSPYPSGVRLGSFILILCFCDLYNFCTDYCCHVVKPFA